MALSPGDKLGPYEIIEPIGKGGMGEVYKARDTRLDRTVAVKVLPEHIAKREDLRTRFEREARAVGSLKHPNICVLHDIGNHDGAGSYMVREFMEGETLADRSHGTRADLRMLRVELAAGQHRRDEAAIAFDEMLREVPSGIPHPDGTERIRRVSNEYGRTQAETSAAFGRLNDFLIDGTIPPHLGGKPE